jgi:hypothetical protein
MSSPYTQSLFSERSDFGHRSTTPVAASAILHVLLIAAVWFIVAYRPPFVRVTAEHYKVRELVLDIPDEARIPPKIRHPAGKPSQTPPALQEVAQAKPGPQTLIQPDVENPVTLAQQIPVPQVVIWKPSSVPVKKITPPPPQPPVSAEAKPSVELPNDEQTLSDVNLASSFHLTPKPLLTASTTSPVTVHAPQQPQRAPMTSSHSSAQPTPAAILSLSNLRMKEGIATLPPVNESVVVKSPGTLAGQGKAPAAPGKDNSSPNPGQGGSTSGPGGNPTNPASASGAGNAPAFKVSGPGLASAGNKPPGPEPGTGTNPDSLDNLDSNQPSTTSVSQPKDGHFSSTVVGNQIEDQYPEVADVWNGRVTYTVYLHVGLAHSWVMQYSVPHTADDSAGSPVSHLEAPWPYDIVRPNLSPGAIDADALMIHGFVNQSGRFEKLSVVFPQSFPQAQFVLAALEKWQFRPAQQDGQAARIEVLLIIPEQFE